MASGTRSRTPALLAPVVPLHITWEPKALAVGEEEMNTLIKKHRSTLRKFTPSAKTAWRDNSTVSRAEFFDAYQEANKANISASVETTTHTMRMINEQTSAEATIL
jgi:hypothetical protein